MTTRSTPRSTPSPPSLPRCRRSASPPSRASSAPPASARSTRSSTSSATKCAASASPRIIAKASPPSSRSGRRNSSAAKGRRARPLREALGCLIVNKHQRGAWPWPIPLRRRLRQRLESLDFDPRLRPLRHPPDEHRRHGPWPCLRQSDDRGRRHRHQSANLALLQCRLRRHAARPVLDLVRGRGHPAQQPHGSDRQGRFRRHLLPPQPAADRLRPVQCLGAAVGRRYPLLLWHHGLVPLSRSASCRAENCSSSASAPCCLARPGARSTRNGCSTCTQSAQAAEKVAPAARTAEQKKAIETWKEKSKTGPTPAEYAALRKANTNFLLERAQGTRRRESSISSPGISTAISSTFSDDDDRHGAVQAGRADARSADPDLSGDGGRRLCHRPDRQHPRSALDHGPRLHRACLCTRQRSATTSAGWR